MATYAQNRKAHFNYELEEKIEAGIELTGHEVKAVRAGRMTLEGAHALVRGGEIFLAGATIAAYQPNNAPPGFDPSRNRRLLLTKKEIAHLASVENTKGLTIVPISVYDKGGKVKLSIAVARGKKKYDKRESIKRRDSERDVQSTLKNEN